MEQNKRSSCTDVHELLPSVEHCFQPYKQDPFKIEYRYDLADSNSMTVPININTRSRQKTCGFMDTTTYVGDIEYVLIYLWSAM